MGETLALPKLPARASSSSDIGADTKRRLVKIIRRSLVFFASFLRHTPPKISGPVEQFVLPGHRSPRRRFRGHHQARARHVSEFSVLSCLSFVAQQEQCLARCLRSPSGAHAFGMPFFFGPLSFVLLRSLRATAVLSSTSSVVCFPGVSPCFADFVFRVPSKPWRT